MKANKYKIAVLTDFKTPVHTMLNNSVCLSKIINATVEVLCIKEPYNVVKSDNQLSAMRTINQEYISTKKEILNSIKPISDRHGIKINHTLSYGNLKDEITHFINENGPDIIVLAKRKSKDSIMSFVLKHFKGTVMISSEENALEPNKSLTLGLLNNFEDSLKVDFEEELMDSINGSLKAFQFIKPNYQLKEKSKSFSKHKDIEEYIFEHSDNSVKNLSNYILKNNVNLLYLNRASAKTKSTLKGSDINQIVNNLDVSLLLSGVN